MYDAELNQTDPDATNPVINVVTTHYYMYFEAGLYEALIHSPCITYSR